MKPAITRILPLIAVLTMVENTKGQTGEFAYLYPIDPAREVAQVDAPPIIIPGARNVVADATPAVDVNSRASVRAFYRSMWEERSFPDLAQNWSGSYASRLPGDLSVTWRKLLLGRLNAFRALAGVPLYEGTNKNWDDYAQAAAFALSINNVLTHRLTPAVSPIYWSRVAAVGAISASIGAGPAARQTITEVDGFMCDYGSQNGTVGHRIRMIAPCGPFVGIGTVPFWGGSPVGRANDDVSASAIINGYDFSDTAANPSAKTRDRFTAWPSRGYFPLQLMTSARWSLQTDLFDPGASFANATIEIYQDGKRIVSASDPLAGSSIVALVDPAQASSGVHPWNHNSALTLPSPTDYPAFPGRDVRFTVRVRNLQDFFTKAPLEDYYYNVIVFDAEALEPTSATSLVPVPTIPSGTKCVGAVHEVDSDVHHPNGNIYDQLLLTGTSATFRADANQIARLSYIDLTDDIVQIEFSGSGRVHVELDAAGEAPAAPIKYNQSVAYMRGHARIYVLDSDANTHISVFSVGRGNAVKQTLFKDGVNYDGIADIALIAIATPTGQLGGLLCGNTHFFASSGFTGVYAPDVAISTGVCRVHDISSDGDAIPVLLTGATPKIEITGGSLQQPNNWPVMIGGVASVVFSNGATSHAVSLPRQTNKATLFRNDTDVTASIVH
jgi:hypothetical protein